MNSQPRVIEEPALTRADIYSGIVEAYQICVETFWQKFSASEYATQLWHVMDYLTERMEEHLVGK